MQALAERLTQAEDAFNTNTSVFSDGMKMLEAQHEVLRRVFQDFMDGRLVLVETVTGRKVPWNDYLKTYIEELVAKEAAEKEQQNGPVLAAPDDDAPIIFGGDQA